MPLDPPGHYDDGDAWYLYFRITAFVPAMPQKFHDAIGDAPTAEAARLLMTAYAAAALDIELRFYPTPVGELAQELEATFDITPQYLCALSVNDIARLMSHDPEGLTERLKAEGFSIENDLIQSYAPAKTAPAKPPAPPKPR